jgi:subtilisin family serine protease
MYFQKFKEGCDMRKNSIIKILSVLILLGLLFSYAPQMATAENAAQNVVTVEQSVLDQLQADGTASYYLEFENNADLSPAFSMNWSDRGWFVYETLKAQADRSQAAALNYLNTNGIEYTPHWINNTIFVKNSNATILNGLQGFEGVQAITAEVYYYIEEPEAAIEEELFAVEPNLTVVQAELAWAQGWNGEGYTVANIDSGVRYTHQALVDPYRGNLGDGTFDHNYNWRDPYASNYQAPRDDNGHGTHTMGTMVGLSADLVNQIGIAPGAEWIACRGCDTNNCAGDQLLSCAEFVTAPTDLANQNPDPDKRPISVNNSWGNCDQNYNPWYRSATDAWVAAGIYPSFSNGNNSNCSYPVDPPINTVGNPGRYGNVSGVGSSTKSTSAYATHSNKGPTDNPDPVNPNDGFEMVKPQFLAPGVGIRSSVNSSDTAYSSYTGTSMSAPHVAGAIAMMVQAAPCLEGEYGIMETVLEQTAFPITHGSFTTHPNNAAGYGEIRVFDAIQTAAGMCGDRTIEGTVKDDSNNLLPGVKVVLVPADPEGYVSNATTDADGFYSAQVYADTYTMTASKTGYLPETKTAIVLMMTKIL